MTLGRPLSIRFKQCLNPRYLLPASHSSVPVRMGGRSRMPALPALRASLGWKQCRHGRAVLSLSY